MKHFYVTFGGLLLNCHLHVVAKNKEIVVAFMKNKSKLGCWCRVLTERPTDTQALKPEAVELYYTSAEHV